MVYRWEKLYSTVEDAKEFIKELNVAEDLYAVYETTDRNFWTDLAKYNQAE